MKSLNQIDDMKARNMILSGVALIAAIFTMGVYIIFRSIFPIEPLEIIEQTEVVGEVYAPGDIIVYQNFSCFKSDAKADFSVVIVGQETNTTASLVSRSLNVLESCTEIYEQIATRGLEPTSVSSTLQIPAGIPDDEYVLEFRVRVESNPFNVKTVVHESTPFRVINP